MLNMHKIDILLALSTLICWCHINHCSAFDITPINDRIEMDDDAVISCQAGGELGNSNIESFSWYKEGKLIEESDTYKMLPNNTLVIKKAKLNEHGGNYECSFILENGQIHNATAVVYGEVFVHALAESKNLVEDDNLNLTCKAEGYPTPTVKWFKEYENGTDEKLDASDERISFTNDGDVGNASIKITKMKDEDKGKYKCVAFNEIEGATYNASSVILIRIKSKYAAVWPFLGIVVEVAILCLIICCYEYYRNKKLAEEDAKEEAANLTNSHANKDDVRQRKV